MKLVKQIGYKLIVSMCIVMMFCCFIASTPVEASKVSTEEFYYSGTVKGSYTVDKSFFAVLIDSLGQIFDYIFGMATMGIRIVFVGWTALMEMMLTWILEGATGEDVEIDKVNATDITSNDKYITVDAIFFNRVPLLDVNVFNFETRDDVTPTGQPLDSEGVQGQDDEHNSPRIVYINEENNTETTIVQGQKENFLTDPGNPDDDSLIIIIKKTIAGWYYTFRVISIMIMLILLIYIGLKLAIQSSASEKALYKRVLVDWLVGMILVFSIHYIMVFIIQFNEMLVTQIATLREGASGLEVYEYGLLERATEPVENDELEMTLYEEVKTRAYDAKFTVGMTGMIMYMVLVYYAWKYTFIYLKRYLTVAVLVMMAPLVAVSYAFNKINTGKSKAFSDWLKEFFFIVILQSAHALIYLVFVDTALAISLNSIAAMLLVFMLLNFMSKAEGIFRKIFGISGKLTEGVAGGGLKDAINGVTGALIGGKIAAKFTKTAGRIATKPLRVAGGAAFGKVMEKRASNSKYKEKNANFLLNQTERTEKLRKGSIAKTIKNKSIDVDALKEAVESLESKKGQIIKNQFGKDVEVTDEYIESEREALEDIMEIDKNKDHLSKQYDELTTRRAIFTNFVGGKWQQIINPYQYVEQDENGKYKAIKTRREYGRWGKKKDSVGMRLRQNTKFTNLLNIDKNAQGALKQQVSLLKNQITGFAGIFAGLPLLVAEPAVGAAFLYKGIEATSKVYSSKGVQTKRKLSNNKKTSKKRLILKGFAGKSEQTIAEGAKAEAREQMETIFIDKARNDKQMVTRLRHRHPKVYAALRGSLNIATNTAVAVGTAALAPVTLPAAVLGVAAGSLSASAIYHGNGRLAGNTWTALHETMKAAQKLDKAAYEAGLQGTEAYLGFLADKYFEMEADQQEKAVESSKKEFTKLYMAAKLAESQAVDEMPVEEVRRELGYEEVEVQTTPDGKVQLSVSSENTIIDNAIIDAAQKSGIQDIDNFEMSEQHLSQVSKEVTMKLKQLGLVGKETRTVDIIQDFEKKIKDRQAVLSKEGTKPVEERMTDKAIVEVMKENNITDPSKVSEEAVMEKFTEMQTAAFGSEPTTGTMDAINNMQTTAMPDGSRRATSGQKTQSVMDRLKTEQGAVPTADGSRPVTPGIKTQEIRDREKARIGTVISARKTILAGKSESASTVEKTKHMKEVLKRKKAAELDAQILQNEAQLEEDPTVAITEMMTNEEGGIGRNDTPDTYTMLKERQDTDNIIKMLQLQTKMHQDTKKAKVAVESMSATERKKEYKKMVFDMDGSIKLDKIRDGSRELKRK